jgi:uncharacterized protein YceK
MAPLVALLCLSGCGTINSYASGCPGVYSGVRQDLDLIQGYQSAGVAVDPEVPLGLDGTLGNAWDTVFVAFDVPLAAIADTLALPVTYSIEPRAPYPQALGCGWATATTAVEESGGSAS